MRTNFREGVGSAVKRVGSALWRHKGDIAATVLGAAIGHSQKARATDPTVRRRIDKWNAFVDRSEASGRKNTYENRTKSSADRLRRVDHKLDADIARGVRRSRLKNTIAGAAVGYATKKLGDAAARAGRWTRRKLLGESQLLELSAGTYQSANDLAKRRMNRLQTMHTNAGSANTFAGGGSATSNFAAKKLAKTSAQQANISGKINRKVAAGVERHRPKIADMLPRGNRAQVLRNTQGIAGAVPAGHKFYKPGVNAPKPMMGNAGGPRKPMGVVGKLAMGAMGGAAPYGGAKLAGMAYRGAKRAGQSAYNYMLARESLLVERAGENALLNYGKRKLRQLRLKAGGYLPLGKTSATLQNRTSRMHKLLGGSGQAPTISKVPAGKQVIPTVYLPDHNHIVHAPGKHELPSGKAVHVTSGAIGHELSHHALHQRGANSAKRADPAYARMGNPFNFSSPKQRRVDNRAILRHEAEANILYAGKSKGRRKFAQKALSSYVRLSYNGADSPAEKTKVLQRYKNFRRAWRQDKPNAHLKLSATFGRTNFREARLLEMIKTSGFKSISDLPATALTRRVRRTVRRKPSRTDELGGTLLGAIRSLRRGGRTGGNQ